MKRLLIIFIAGLLTSFSTIKSKVKETSEDVSSFVYNIDFQPSFMEHCSISITKKDKTGQIKLTIYKYTPPNSAIVDNYVDSIELSESDFSYFFNTLGTISLMKMKSDSSIGYDGISIHNTFYTDSFVNAFYFWSPNKWSKEHKIVEALIGLSRQKFTSKKYQDYFESLEQYFEFGLPCKIICENPYEVRIYGSLSSDEKDELIKFINELPVDRPILVDMTNFWGMGTMYYPLFRNLIKRNKNILWVTKDTRQLDEIGVDKSKIVEDIDEARKLMK